MKLNRIKTRKALNPEYRKHKPKRSEVNSFRAELKKCLVSIKSAEEVNESEEFIKTPIATFLKNTFFADNLVNTKGRIDLAIYTGKDLNSDVGVIIEAKKPSNKSEFISEENLNRKALQELLLYYLRERIDNENNNIKTLIATNGYEWYLFKGEDFYKYFYKNTSLIKEYKAFKDGQKDSEKTELFYSEIAKKYIAEIENELPFVYLNFTKKRLEDYTDQSLNTLYKVFSDVNILGNSFANDSNELNKSFYNELLHIIGLEETKDKGKKVIYRKDEGKRDYASFLENAIFKLEDQDHLSKVTNYTEDKAFNVGLTLCLTWVNRILFLKLLESQLKTYHPDEKEKYSFLNTKFISGFDDLNDLFFSALARDIKDRHPKFKDKYQHIPYLNSSLFERNDLETDTIEISSLNDEKIEVYKTTVLKENGKRFKGKLNTLDYLFKFLDAFDFATDGTEGISDEEESKTLINASVLGMIFEKINGYKEGSFYTPAYITMYMCKETLRRAVVQKFKEKVNEDIDSFADLTAYCHDKWKPEDKKRLNTVFNSLKVCDPAVGSGHFLVSALNELIVIKHELTLLVDVKGNRLSGYDIHIENDELYVTDEEGNLIDYKQKNKESARVQHTLFHEKQTIIENCLFGVDINPNSVKICRLRLWIELLKNAYYTKSGVFQTLPNIDINIKCGNSLISRFDLKDDLQDAFNGKDVKYNFTDYKEAVKQYKQSNSKEQKGEVLEIINEVKNNFISSLDDDTILDRQKAVGKYETEKARQDNLLLFEEKITKADKKILKELKIKADKAIQKETEIVNNKIYDNAFEWRFEFPEVLDEVGNYIGFDLIIGNPPYLIEYDKQIKSYLEKKYIEFKRNNDLYVAFIILGYQLLSENSIHSFITPNTFIKGSYFIKLREFFIANQIFEIIDFRNKLIFDEANVYCSIFQYKKCRNPIDWTLKTEIDTREGLIERSELDFIYKNKLIKKLDLHNKFIKYFEIKDVGFNYWSVGRGKTRGGSVGSRILYKGEKINLQDRSYLKGSNIFKYQITTPSNYLKHNYTEFLTENDVFRFSKEYFEKSEKIIYRQTSKDIVAAIDFNQNYNDKTVHILINKDGYNFNLKYVLSLLNSKLFDYYLQSYKQEGGKAFAQIKTVDVKNFPFIDSNQKTQQSFEEKVNQILSLKQGSPKVDTSALEKEIDAMVYELYDLTVEEIKIVEGS
jgi:adenine-specific DNA-methyltransferase